MNESVSLHKAVTTDAVTGRCEPPAIAFKIAKTAGKLWSLSIRMLRGLLLADTQVDLSE
jgi:hypothetical protein